MFWWLKEKYFELSNTNGKNLLLTVTEHGKSKIKVLADSVSGEGLISHTEYILAEYLYH